MAWIFLGFLAMLMVSFGAVMAMTGESREEQTVAHRMALIHLSASKPDGTTPEIEQFLKPTNASRFRWLDSFLKRYRFAQTMQLRILQANSTITVAGLIVTSGALFAGGYGIAWVLTGMFLIDVVAGAALCLVPSMVLAWRRSRRVAAFNNVLAEGIDMLARALRAGHSIVSAMEMLAENAQEPVRSEFAEIFRQLNLGLPLREALVQLLHRVPSSDLRVLVTAILVQKDTGGNLVEILDRTVFVIRERLRIEGEIQVQTAQGRLTGWILSALPLVMLALLNLVNPGYSTILFRDPVGRKLVYVSGGMLLIGSLIIRRIVNGIEV
jgi:tight adherence protein B